MFMKELLSPIKFFLAVLSCK